MVEWLKSWANQVIVAVIIAVIFELIIPNGKNKKYIKMVINLYVLFVLINPIISKFTDINDIDLSKYNYEGYFSQENSIETSSSLDSNKIVNNTVENKIAEDIKNKLASEGYNVTSISININSSDNNYGEINSIKLSIVGADDSVCPKEQNNSSIQINEIEEININSKTEAKDKTLRKSEIKKVKKIISEEYDVSEENIEVN